jgi:hypothetical protein
MTSTHSSFAAFLEELCADYRSSLPQQLEQIESLWRQVLNGEAPAQALCTQPGRLPLWATPHGCWNWPSVRFWVRRTP